MRGFTLIEVSLAIVIGVLVIAGGIALYGQVKTAAGNGAAQDKVTALHGMIEETQAKQGSLPKGDSLYANWTSAREDYSKNPWGGTCGDPTAMVGMVGESDYCRKDGFISDSYDPTDPANNTFAAGTDANSNAYVEYYFNKAGVPVAPINVWDQVLGKNVPAKQYWVGIIGPKGELNEFVQTSK